MTTESKTENPVFISVMSIYNKKQLSTLLYSFEQLVKIAKDASYDGLEWHPNRLPSGGQLEYGNVDVEALSCIKTLHQNWTGGEEYI